MSYTTDPSQFLQEQKDKIGQYFSTNKLKLINFKSQIAFIEWYIRQLDAQALKCHYCEISILDYRRLINNNLLKGRKVRGAGLRGPNFEIDRMDSNGDYIEENCVLCCYYCNNDKSNTFNYNVYKTIIGPSRKVAISNLLSQIK